ncbi:MAG: thiamine pyrophosphate-dependent enzyme, partial [Candidatus Caldatribacteriota bacterium]|nr:thiamine pyrophosphate-dependent enzyme [Candidatus Caldatribacteriota bacterium]
EKLSPEIGKDLVNEIKNADQSSEEGLAKQRERVEKLVKKIDKIEKPEANDLLSMIDVLTRKSVWILGGDGWAYDIGYGGLDHVIAQKRNVNILVLDTETYSNTGGQMSKATPLGAIAKFAAGGKRTLKKDLAMMAVTYGSVYVARVAMGANDSQVIKAFREAEAFDGPSIIIAYSHCISHGYNLINGLNQQKLAVQSGYWPLIRYNPTLAKEGKNPLQLDSKPPSIPLEDYIYNENRYKMLTRNMPEEAKKLLKEAQEGVNKQWRMYQRMASTSEK